MLALTKANLKSFVQIKPSSSFFFLFFHIPSDIYSNQEVIKSIYNLETEKGLSHLERGTGHCLTALRVGPSKRRLVEYRAGRAG